MNSVAPTTADRHEFGDESARLRWAYDGDRLVHASHAIGKRELRYECPACRRKVGPVSRSRTAFFRHATKNEGCWTHGAESRDHHLTKESLVAALQAAKGTPLTAMVLCGCDDPHQAPTWTLPDWDDVAAERDMGGAFADIVLLREDVIVAVIEVYRSSTVTMKKAELMRELKLPWIEIPIVSPGHEFVDGRRKRRSTSGITWQLDEPLRARRSGPTPQGCPVCEAARAAAARSGEVNRLPAGPNPLVVADEQGRLSRVWQRSLWQPVNGGLHLLCTLEICDISSTNGVRQRCLCLANHRHVLAWSSDGVGQWEVDVVREQFRGVQREFIQTLRSLTHPQVDRWTQIGEPSRQP